MTPVSVSTQKKKRESLLTLVEDRSRIAGRFLAARRAAAGLDDYPGDFPATLDEAYAIQDEAIAALGPAGDRLEGRPGAAAPDRPLRHRPAGRADLRRGSRPAATAPRSRCRSSPRASPPARPSSCSGSARRRPPEKTELQPRRGRRPDRRRPCRHRDRQLAPGPINELGPIAVISDFGNNNGLVDRPRNPGLADERLRAMGGRDPDRRRRGRARGRAAGFPDGAIGAARFLFELMARRGIALAPGQWISSGAVTGVHPAPAGPARSRRVSATVSASPAHWSRRGRNSKLGEDGHGRRSESHGRARRRAGSATTAG